VKKINDGDKILDWINNKEKPLMANMRITEKMKTYRPENSEF
jgi:hypothetical protein